MLCTSVRKQIGISLSRLYVQIKSTHFKCLVKTATKNKEQPDASRKLLIISSETHPFKLWRLLHGSKQTSKKLSHRRFVIRRQGLRSTCIANMKTLSTFARWQHSYVSQLLARERHCSDKPAIRYALSCISSLPLLIAGKLLVRSTAF